MSQDEPLPASREPAPVLSYATPADDASPVLSYAQPGVGELVTVARFPEVIEASLAAAKLEAEGIEASLEGMQADAYFGMARRPSVFSGPRLLVYREDVMAAREVLATTPARRCLVDPIAPDESSGPTCPFCKSADVRAFPYWTWMIVGCSALILITMVVWNSLTLALMLAMIWLAILRFIPSSHCADCGKRYTDVDVDLADEEDNDRARTQ